MNVTPDGYLPRKNRSFQSDSLRNIYHEFTPLSMRKHKQRFSLLSMRSR